MRVVGYCTECRKIKYVRILRWIYHGSIQHGICDDCERKRKT